MGGGQGVESIGYEGLYHMVLKGKRAMTVHIDSSVDSLVCPALIPI